MAGKPTPRPNALAPWSLRLLDVLGDGQWHSRDELVGKAGQLIPPGRAMRMREAERARIAAAAPPPKDPTKKRPKPRERSEDYYLAVGRRRIIVDVLQGHLKTGRMVREDRDGVPYYKQGPNYNHTPTSDKGNSSDDGTEEHTS